MSGSPSFHERFDRPETIRASSDKKFCLTISIILSVIAAIKYWHNSPYALPLFLIAFLLLATGLAKPSLAGPLNRAWLKLGLLLASITNPIVISLIYSVAIVPVGFCMRLSSKDPMQRSFDKSATTYWITRPQDNPETQSMNNQF